MFQQILTKLKKKPLFFIIPIMIIAVIGIYFYQRIFSSQIEKTQFFYVKSTDNLEDVMTSLDKICKNANDVAWVATLKKFKTVKPGKYEFKEGFSANHIINLLRSGEQTPVQVTFNNQDYIENLAGRLSTQIEADSLTILKTLTEPSFLKKYNLNNKGAIQLYMPYSYECYWNIKPEDLRDKMANAYTAFWNTDRTAKAKKQGLTPNQAISLAAIVQKESADKSERPRIAGVYLNRFHQNMALQADPTVIFAVKEMYKRDTIIKRVLNRDLRINSPYNTYANVGIPPTAITMPDIDAIEAVLNPEKHNYIFFCANPNKIGTHNFATTLEGHERNAKIYQQWLNKQHVMR